eukprot:6214778-Pleurochrysis_carterae.AAC.1
MASLVAALAATISASHDNSATVACFFDDQEMAARLYMKTNPDVEWRIHQDAAGGSEEFRSGTAHSAAKKTDGVGDVGSGLRGAVEKRTYERLVVALEFRIDITCRFGAERLVDKGRQVLRSGRLSLVEGERHPVGQVGLDEMADVFLLFQDDAVSVRGDINIEQI